MTTAPDINKILQGPDPDPDELFGNFKPVRYRYIMAYLHDYKDSAGVLHKAGELMYVLPIVNVTYGIGIYKGTEFSGDLHLPSFYLDQMPHAPSNTYSRWPHPDKSGIPLGSLFECGNRAFYVMRNNDVVWGGILWTRDYTGGSPTMHITAISFDAYLYHRTFRRSIVFDGKHPVNMYLRWYAVVRAALSDFTWSNPYDGIRTSNATYDAKTVKRTKKTKGHPSRIISTTYTFWTGLSKSTHNAAPTNYRDQWPYNTPKIELPAHTLRWYSDYPKTKKPVLTSGGWRGYDLGNMGEALQEWASNWSITGYAKRFEYRVVCFYDATDRKFRQRYVFGEMKYASGAPNTPTAIVRPLLGSNTKWMAQQPGNVLSFNYPGQISSWALTETMEGCATRVIVSNQGDKATKHAEYATDKDLLDRPKRAYSGSPRGSQGWLLYDTTASYNISNTVAGIKTKKVPKPKPRHNPKLVATLRARAATLLTLFKAPTAQQIDDLSNRSVSQRASRRSSSFTVTLYADPTTPLPAFKVGDWASFHIEDPFYGGVMHLVRRITGYTVTVVGEQENDYSHESIELELTDDNQIGTGE